jgi:hypothetical protein
MEPPKAAEHLVNQPEALPSEAPLDNQPTSHFSSQPPLAAESTMQIELPDTGDTELPPESTSALESESTALFQPSVDENVATHLLELPEHRQPAQETRSSRPPGSLSQIARSPFSKEGQTRDSSREEKKVSFPAKVQPSRKPEGGQS